jgi:FtsP/CotA-like multicopper oxidase with cupredoxin domain
MRLSSTHAAAAIMVTLAGCATTKPPTPPEVPAQLRAPAGQVAYLKALAIGVQIYECATKPEGGHEWTFKAPEATLTDESGRGIGKHYAGPTWEANDGSTVVAQVSARAPSPQPSAIPWLLLTAKSNSGFGAFAGTTSIQRVATVGGLAPAQACTGDNAQQLARVPYGASYYFYRQAVY